MIDGCPADVMHASMELGFRLIMRNDGLHHL